MNSDNSSADKDGAAARASQHLITHNARLGLVLFAIYCVIYAGFVVVSTFFPDLMARRIEAVGGVNVAIAYGMFLILAAFVLAMIYMVLCKGEPREEVTP